MSISKLSRDELWSYLKENLQLDNELESSNENNDNSSCKDSVASAAQEQVIQTPPSGKADEHISSSVKPDAVASERLEDIRYYASWTGEDGATKLRALRELFLDEYPGLKAHEEQFEKYGRLDILLYNNAYKLGKDNRNKKVTRSLINDSEHPLSPKIETKIWIQYHKGLKAALKRKEEKELSGKGKQLSLVQLKTRAGGLKMPAEPLLNRRASIELSKGTSLHPNDIRSLDPSNTWDLVIDETGGSFTNNNGNYGRDRGRFVGILIPGGKASLPDLNTQWHAVDQSNSSIDKVIQDLLDSNTGVMGIDTPSLPVTRGEQWVDGIALLIEWVLRLMPIDGNCDLHVFIERRGIHDSSPPWEVLCRDCLRGLALAFPSRARHIGMSISIIGKSGHRYNGYADAVAYTWGKTSQTSIERLAKSKLEGTCLWDKDAGIDARSLLFAWDSHKQGVSLIPSKWWEMMQSDDAHNPCSILKSFLDNVGAEANSSITLWSTFLNEVKNRIATSPLSLKQLASVVDWLQQYQPNNTIIPAPMRLIWLTIQLAQANHMGIAELKWETELAQLAEKLYDEAAPLVCQADLHRAVSYTNRFDFAGATKVLEKWSCCKPSEPGLLFWGQLQSSIGQHYAFINNNDTAIGHFEKAIKAFSRLSDAELCKSNTGQTGSYLAICLMDSLTTTEEQAESALERITGTLPGTAAVISESTDSYLRYSHHLLLRYLVYRGNESWRNAYMENKEKWFAGNGHPWPLIQLYRAILLHDSSPEEAAKYALSGASDALQGSNGATVRYIGACCRMVARMWGSEWSEMDETLEKLTKELPAAAERIANLKTTASQSSTPQEFLQKALPFNFR